jgi:predicted GNAT family acetyltransferase
MNVMHPLDNVIWSALTTRDAHFAEGSGSVRRFIREVGPLGAFAEPSGAGYDTGYKALLDLVEPGATIGLFLHRAYESRPEWTFVAGAPLLQMICDNGQSAAPVKNPVTPPQILRLGDADSPEMIDLTALTKPGPFSTRTHELGTYLGIRHEGKLVAMAGERLKVPGYTEVSAVCTHPDHLGKGYAALLMSEIMRGIRQRGETPILHVRADNDRAIALYERLGFRIRLSGHFAVLRRK